MQVHVSGKGVDVGEALRGHIEGQLSEHINKYSDRITSVQVVVSREAHLFRVDVTGNIGTHSGLVVRSRGEAGDAHSAFDDALEKTTTQLRRYKRKLTNHHGRHADEAPAAALPQIKGRKYTLKPEVGEEDEARHAALVIAEAATEIGTMTVSQAVMKMDLQDLPALMFFNSAHGRLNVVYRRKDGNIAWVDPETRAA
jgi:ribosomal subunit interface protein